MTPRRNIEFKARCGDLAAVRSAALALGARVDSIQVQTDTYFIVPHGRLKLRQIDGSRAELIGYHRADEAAARQSDYILCPIADPDALLAALSATLGLRGQVYKRREVLLYHNVRIHLDEVEALGTFIEFEAVVDAQNDESVSRQRLETLTAALGIEAREVESRSYVDLLGL